MVGRSSQGPNPGNGSEIPREEIRPGLRRLEDRHSPVANGEGYGPWRNPIHNPGQVSRTNREASLTLEHDRLPLTLRQLLAPETTPATG